MKVRPLTLPFLVCWILLSSRCADFQERDFIKRELNGPLIKLEDIKHGQSYVYIADYLTKDTVRYALRITEFISENKIEAGDSISKAAESHTTLFYKKRNGRFEKVAELYYY